MTDRLDLPDRYRRQIEALLAEHVPDAEVWAYGSRVTGRSHAASDLDLVLRGPNLKRIPTDQLADLEDAFKESSIPILIQTHDWARLPASFHEEIENQYVVLRQEPRQEDTARDEPQGWVIICLGDACTKIGSGATPRGGKEAYCEDGPIRLIRSQNVHNDRFRRDGLASIDHVQASKLEKVAVQAADVLLNITGDSVARSCQVAVDVLPARVNQHVAILRSDPEILSASFLRYLLITPRMQSKLLSMAHSGGTRKALTKSDIESLEIQIPRSVATQETTARILALLDEKVETNLRISNTLEDTVSSLFKSWFIDFDPAQAKVDGRHPLLPEHLMDLFPDRLSSSTLGLIPEGWTVEPLCKIADHLRDTEHPGNSPDAMFSHYSIPAYDSSMEPVEQYGDSIKSHKTIMKPGVVLVSRLNPDIKRIWLPHVTKDKRTVCSTEFMVLMPKRPFTSSYLYCLVCSTNFRRNLTSLVTGTSKSHQRAPVKAIMSTSVLVPPTEIVTGFDQYASRLLDRVLLHRAEAALLRLLRGSLLPKLLSGVQPRPRIH